MLAQGVDMKYIDPSYQIRAVPTNCNDRIYCKVEVLLRIALCNACCCVREPKTIPG